MVHIYNEIILTHQRNKFESVELRWMNLELVMQSEVDQIEKNKSCMSSFLCGIETRQKTELIEVESKLVMVRSEE